MKSIGFKVLYVITAIVVIVEVAFSVNSSLFTDISELPKGTLMYSEKSPSGKKTVNIYLVENNLGTAVRGEIAEDGTSHNIFWQTGIDDVNVYWSDNKNIVINDIPLDSTDTFGYDCRRGYSLFNEGSIEQGFMNTEEK